MNDFNFQAPLQNSGANHLNDDDPVYKIGASSGVSAFNNGNASLGVDPLGAITGWGAGMSLDINPPRPYTTPEPPVEEQQFASVLAEYDSVTKESDQIMEPSVRIQEQIQEQVNIQPQPSSGQVQEIEVSKIFPNPFQPRKYFEPKALQELADSILVHGVIQPIVVTRSAAGYELVVGERRFRASVLAGLATVPAIVKGEMADLAKLEVALIENIQRHELNPIEEAQAYDRLMKGFGMKQEEVARKLGKARPTIANTLRLLNLPAEIQRGIIEGKLAEGHARPLLSLQDRTQQLALYQEVLDKGLNARQIEARVREMASRKSVDGVAPDPRLMALESKLRGQLGTQVKIQRQGRGGKIMIEFFSEADLEDIVNKMAERNASVPKGGEEYITV